jgi:hypothetical protein
LEVDVSFIPVLLAATAAASMGRKNIVLVMETRMSESTT